jgi:hypothetical protein
VRPSGSDEQHTEAIIAHVERRPAMAAIHADRSRVRAEGAYDFGDMRVATLALLTLYCALGMAVLRRHNGQFSGTIACTQRPGGRGLITWPVSDPSTLST